jgi:ATP-dependent Clp protease protease subunit
MDNLMKKIIPILLASFLLSCNPTQTPSKFGLLPMLTNETSESDLKKVKDIRIRSKQIVKLEGVVGSAQTQYVVSDILDAGKRGKRIYLIINSPGGSVIAGNQIITAMENVRAPVYTVCIKFCASMAAIIHQHGKKRYMLDRSILMFHRASLGLQGYLEEVKTRLNFFETIIKKENRYIANRLNMPLELYERLLAEEIWVDAEQAVITHMTDNIVNLQSKNPNDKDFYTLLKAQIDFTKDGPWTF